MANLVLIAFISLAVLSAFQGGSAVEYSVANTVGSVRFDTEIGVQYTEQTMDAATNFIWKIFQQDNPSDRKTFERVSLFVNNFNQAPACTTDDVIQVSASYIQNFGGDIKREITGIIYHEMTHVWQWSGNGQAPGVLIEGIADFVRLKAGFVPDYWAKPGEGDRWDQGYAVTARFLDYCNDLRSGTFVAELNKKMRDGYSDDFFQELLGKSVNDLFSMYKDAYRNRN